MRLHVLLPIVALSTLALSVNACTRSRPCGRVGLRCCGSTGTVGTCVNPGITQCLAGECCLVTGRAALTVRSTGVASTTVNSVDALGTTCNGDSDCCDAQAACTTDDRSGQRYCCLGPGSECEGFGDDDCCGLSYRCRLRDGERVPRCTLDEEEALKPRPSSQDTADCGHDGRACCNTKDSCQTGLVCRRRIGSSLQPNVCVRCGHEGGPCCDDNECNEAKDCRGSVCKACGALGQACCRHGGDLCGLHLACDPATRRCLDDGSGATPEQSPTIEAEPIQPSQPAQGTTPPSGSPEAENDSSSLDTDNAPALDEARSTCAGASGPVECLGIPGCGWCVDSSGSRSGVGTGGGGNASASSDGGRCLPGGPVGPSAGNCANGDWRFSQASISANIDRCSSGLGSCKRCLQIPGCGYCVGICIPGDANGPFDPQEACRGGYEDALTCSGRSPWIISLYGCRGGL